MGMVVDPQFPTRPYVYALYAYDHQLGGPARRRSGATPCPSPEPGRQHRRLHDLGQARPADHERRRHGGDRHRRPSSRTGASSSPATRSAAWRSGRKAPCTSRPATAPASTGPTTGEEGGSFGGSIGHAGQPVRRPDRRGRRPSLPGHPDDRRPARPRWHGPPHQPGHRRRLAGQRQLRERRRQRPEDHRLRPAQPLPDDDPRQRAVWIGDVGFTTWEEIDTIPDPDARAAQLRLAVPRGQRGDAAVRRPRHPAVRQPAGARRPGIHLQPRRHRHRRRLRDGQLLDLGDRLPHDRRQLPGQVRQRPVLRRLHAGAASGSPRRRARPRPRTSPTIEQFANLRRSGDTNGGAVWVGVTPAGDIIYADYDRNEVRQIRYVPGRPAGRVVRREPDHRARRR